MSGARAHCPEKGLLLFDVAVLRRKFSDWRRVVRGSAEHPQASVRMRRCKGSKSSLTGVPTLRCAELAFADAT